MVFHCIGRVFLRAHRATTDCSKVRDFSRLFKVTNVTRIRTIFADSFGATTVVLFYSLYCCTTVLYCVMADTALATGPRDTFRASQPCESILVASASYNTVSHAFRETKVLRLAEEIMHTSGFKNCKFARFHSYCLAYRARHTATSGACAGQRLWRSRAKEYSN